MNKKLSNTSESGSSKTFKSLHHVRTCSLNRHCGLQVLMEACQAKGCDVIIIATETDVNGGPVTRRYLNVPPSPDTSPVSCMSPSDIVLKTGSPHLPPGENIFNFRGSGERDAMTLYLSRFRIKSSHCCLF